MEAHSSGLSLTNSKWLSVRDVNRLPSICTTDSWTSGSVRFTTHIDAYGEDSAFVTFDAVNRLISIAILQRLSGHDLKSVCENLVDSFYWKLIKTESPTNAPGPRKKLNSTIKRIKAQPVVLDKI